jgi:hypothetical protein
MKTLELKLKKDVLIVEIPRLADYEFINKECKYIKVGNEEIKLNASTLDKFEFLCKGSELTEEIASELVEDYSDVSDLFISCLDDFKKRIERCGFYWLENPISRPRNYELWAKYGDYTQYGIVLTEKCLKWQEAEGKTFRNPLIFVKK